MKLKLLFSVCFLALCFSSAFGFHVGATVTNSEDFIAASSSQKHSDISIGGTHLFGLTPESEISIAGYQYRFQAEDKNFVKFYPSFDFSETLVLVLFKHYAVFYNNCLIAFRKSDRIFPFHYFW